jgi:hypothetical protein
MKWGGGSELRTRGSRAVDEPQLSRDVHQGTDIVVSNQGEVDADFTSLGSQEPTLAGARTINTRRSEVESGREQGIGVDV